MFQVFLYMCRCFCRRRGDSKTAIKATESVVHVSNAQQHSVLNSFSALLMHIMSFSAVRLRVCVRAWVRVQASAGGRLVWGTVIDCPLQIQFHQELDGAQLLEQRRRSGRSGGPAGLQCVFVPPTGHQRLLRLPRQIYCKPGQGFPQRR